MAAKKTTKKTTKKKSASKKPNALEFARIYLRKKPKAEFAEIRDAAKKKRIKLYPISYGRAQALEGLVKVSPYGSRKKSKSKRGPGRPKGSKNKSGPGRPLGSKNKRGPGRPRKSSASADSLESLVSTIKTLQRERDDAVRAVEKIRNLLDTF